MKNILNNEYSDLNDLFKNNFYINASSKQSKPTNYDQSVLDFNDLALGDPVVHQKHGIGRFVAIDRMPVSDKTREFIKIIYRNNDKLLLPVENLNLVNDELNRPMIGKSGWSVGFGVGYGLNLNPAAHVTILKMPSSSLEFCFCLKIFVSTALFNKFIDISYIVNSPIPNHLITNGPQKLMNNVVKTFTKNK